MSSYFIINSGQLNNLFIQLLKNFYEHTSQVLMETIDCMIYIFAFGRNSNRGPLIKKTKEA